MLTQIWDVALYEPLVNALAFLVSIVPGGDIGIAVILLTIIVKVILFPLSQKSIENQAKMKLLEPELKKIKAAGGSKEEQARQTMDLYKRHNTSPFSGCLLILLQIPIIFALYYVFFKGLNIDSSLLYSFIPTPDYISTNFLGLLDITGKSLVLAVLAGVSQFFQAYFMPQSAPTVGGDPNSFQENFAKSMQVQMKYVFPLVVAFIAYSVSGAVALYWITSNVFQIGQQIYSNKKKHLDLSVEVK